MFYTIKLSFDGPPHVLVKQTIFSQKTETKIKRNTIKMIVWYHQSTIFKQRRVLQIAGLVSLCVALITTLLFGYSAYAAPGVNKTLTFQGRLLSSSGSVVADGYYNMQFKIYQDGNSQGTGSSEKWYETYINNGGQNGIEVVNGYFSVNLGSKESFDGKVDWNQDTLWLSMNIAGKATDCTAFNSGSCVADGEMKPMRRITATPIALNSNAVGGKTADQLVQLGQGVQDHTGNGSSLGINKTGSGDFIQLQKSGSDIFRVANSGNIIFGGSDNHSITVSSALTGNAGSQLLLQAGGGGSGDGSAGGDLVLRGGDAGGSDASGGNIVLGGGNGSGNGVSGLVIIGTPTFSTVTNDANCYASGALVANSCTVDGSSVDGSAAIIVGFSANSKTAAIPDPTNTTAGRVIYVMAASGSKDFGLVLNGGGTGNTHTMRENSAITLMWNGNDWLVAGTSSSNSLMGNTDADGTLANIQIGKGDGIGNPTLLTLDKSAGNPTVTNDSALLGSMYYDTNIGRIQCYEASGWGDCSAAPDTFVTLSPEYSNAVINGSTSGTLKSDICSNSLGLNDGSGGSTAVCGTNETYNFYGWNSTDASDQTRSIYVTYKLPSNFKEFVPESLTMMAKTDHNEAKVSYEIYRDHGANGLTQCGIETTAATGAIGWTSATATSNQDPASCSFEAGDSILIRINLTAKNNHNAYVSNLNFVYSNN